MDVQPWFSGTVDIRLPKRASSQGILLMSNHRSTLDAFILLSRVRGIRIFTKTSLLSIPFLGFMMRMSGQIAAKRGQIDSFMRGMDIVRQRLRGGEVVHIFPELTRCDEGFVGLQNFSSYPFLLAIQEKVTIVPILFHETDRVWPKGKLGLRFRHPVSVSSLAPIDAGAFSSAEALQKHFRGRLHDHSPLPVHSHLQQQSDY
jgi:1-acyl-sn-glycerol-3-phosphate acyltransferase